MGGNGQLQIDHLGDRGAPSRRGTDHGVGFYQTLAGLHPGYPAIGAVDAGNFGKGV